MMATANTPPDIAHITPIVCPACKTGKSSLVERHSDDSQSSTVSSEIWVFQCDSCDAMSVRAMDR